jgi:hypothetical protein
MKKLLVMFLAATALCACQNGKESRANDSGIKLETKGLDAKGHYLMVGEEKIMVKEFSPGTKVYYVFDTVSGFTVKDGRVSPGASMVLRRGGNEVLNIPDLFAEYATGVDSSDIAQELELILTLGENMEEGAEYDWAVRVWDKNGKGEMSANIPIKIVAPKDNIGIQTTSKGLSCPRIYIFSNGPLMNNKVRESQELDFVFSGLSGFEVGADSTVSVGASVVVKNKAGETIMEYPDIFKDYGAVSAIDATLIKADLTIGNPITPGQAYTWIVRIYDKSNNKSIESAAEIDVQL